MAKRAQALTPDDLEPGEVEILRLGKHHGAPYEFTSEEFDEIVADYEPGAVHQAQAVIDHDPDDLEPTDPRRKGTNQGLVDRLRRVKDSVVARLSSWTPELAELVNTGRLHAISPEIYRQFLTTGRKHLRAVAFLGADTPAQKALLRPVLLHEGTPEASMRIPLQNPVLRFSEGETEGDPTMTAEEKAAKDAETKKAADAAAKALADKAAADQLAADRKAAQEKHDADIEAARRKAAGEPEPVLSLSEVTKAIDAAVAPLLEKVTRLNARLEESDPEYGDRAILKFGEELVRDGKIEGKDRERLVARAKALRGQTIKLGEGADAREVSALEDFMAQERERAVLPQFEALDVNAPNGAGRARAQNGVLKFAEGKKPKFQIHVPEGTSKDEIARLTKLGEFAAENEITSFAEASVRFEREAEGIGAR